VKAVLALGLTMLAAMPRPAAAWGDEGHAVVAFIAQSFLEPDVRAQVNALLAGDTDNLAAHDIASAATWADRYREGNIDGSRARTRQWHFTDIEITAPDLDQACFSHPEGYVRMSFCGSESDINRAFDRIESWAERCRSAHGAGCLDLAGV
jgi:hypothetical protein